MTTEIQNPFVERALSGSPVWSIGQIDKETKRQLDKLVKIGALLKGRGHWQGISSAKTVWFLPTVEFSYLEDVVR